MCTCVKCQNTKFIYKKKYGLYRPLPILRKPWESVSMDLMTQLPEWNGMDAIFMLAIDFPSWQKWLQLRCSPQFLIWLSYFLICGSSITRCHNLSLVIEMPSLWQPSINIYFRNHHSIRHSIHKSITKQKGPMEC